jgi:glycolate oxidase iron-sulfur subunit
MADRKLIDECVHCGFCLPACPTYQSSGREVESPRGRIYTMKALSEGRATVGPAVLAQFDSCLGCMGCVTACPSGVQYDALIEQTRAELEQARPRTRGDRLFRALVFSLFPHPARLRLAVLLQLLYVRSGLRWLLHRLGLPRLLPPRLRQLEALLPEVSAHHLTAGLPAFTPAQGPRRARVALLPGCVQRVYFPGVNEATVRVLGAEGCEVVVPRDLGCCGALSVHAGRLDEARTFARAAIAALEAAQPDFVVINAAGCGSSMKEWGRLLADDPAWAPRAEAMAAKVRDATELLAALGPVATRHPLPLRVAYHDACHLAHAQRIRAPPRALLQGIPGLELAEIPEGEQCCGSAGIYNLVEPERSREIGLRKVENVLSVSPQLVVSANPGCTLQLTMLLKERGLTLRAAHPLELLDLSLRGQGMNW